MNIAPVVGNEGLSNIPIGDIYGTQLDICFMAQDVCLDRLEHYLIAETPGYGQGTLGTLGYQLFADKAGQPDQSVCLATGIVVVPGLFVRDGHVGGFPYIAFSQNEIMVGEQYHVVVTDLDPHPTLNWCSADFLVSKTLNQYPDIKIMRAGKGLPFELVDGGTVQASPLLLGYASGKMRCLPYIDINNELGTEYGFPAAQ